LKKLLIIGFVWPEPNSSAAGSRMLQLIEQFQNQRFKIIFATAANKGDNAFDLSSTGVQAEKIELNNLSFDNFITSLCPDVVLFDRFMIEEQYGWRVAEQCPNALRILDTEDFHGLRKARGEALKNKKSFTIQHLQNDTTKREVASIYRCDLSLIISEAEIKILKEQLGVDQNLLYYLPFLLDSISQGTKDSLPKFEDREHFIFIGNFLHQPNYDAVLYLKNTIWPLIRNKLPEAQLHVYGAYESQKVTQLHNKKEGFLVKGFAEDVNTVMQSSRVCLAPLRFGAGLKGKLIDAMKNGTPTVMSTIAAEGMFADGDLPYLISDEPNTFAKQAVELYSKKLVWKMHQDKGFSCMNDRFNVSNFKHLFKEKIEFLLQNLQQHRQQNFTGQLLMHHTLQSTKYMSKWIEKKNR